MPIVIDEASLRRIMESSGLGANFFYGSANPEEMMARLERKIKADRKKEKAEAKKKRKALLASKKGKRGMKRAHTVVTSDSAGKIGKNRLGEV